MHYANKAGDQGSEAHSSVRVSVVREPQTVHLYTHGSCRSCRRREEVALFGVLEQCCVLFGRPALHLLICPTEETFVSALCASHPSPPLPPPTTSYSAPSTSVNQSPAASSPTSPSPYALSTSPLPLPSLTDPTAVTMPMHRSSNLCHSHHISHATS